jgi:hypothetical protein
MTSGLFDFYLFIPLEDEVTYLPGLYSITKSICGLISYYSVTICSMKLFNIQDQYYSHN